MPRFVDRVVIHAKAGNGGRGCASVHREKFKPLGGPDGGNGGDGGSVILRVDDSLSTLVDYHRQSVRKATNGQPGKGDHQHGARGEAVVLPVPSGTVVTDAETGEGEQGPEDSDAKKEKKEADPDKLKKAIIQVKHDDRPARLILNRRPPAEGWAWLKYEDDGQEFEADLGTVQLVALLEG